MQLAGLYLCIFLVISPCQCLQIPFSSLCIVLSYSTKVINDEGIVFQDKSKERLQDVYDDSDDKDCTMVRHVLSRYPAHPGGNVHRQVVGRNLFAYNTK